MRTEFRKETDQDRAKGRTRVEAVVLTQNLKEKDPTEESSMDISETDIYYVVSFFPDAAEVEIDDKPEKGYKAIIGIQDDEHVVMKVMYAKNMYDLNRVIELAGNIKECPICERLDANVAVVKNIRLRDQYTSPPKAKTTVAPVTVSDQEKSKLFDTGNPLQDLMAQMLFDTKLNNTGQVATALALEDNALLKRAMPTSIDGIVGLMANLTELSQGRGDIYRTPEEVTAYVEALREGTKPSVDDEKKKNTPVVFRRAPTVIVS